MFRWKHLTTFSIYLLYKRRVLEFRLLLSLHIDTEDHFKNIITLCFASQHFSHLPISLDWPSFFYREMILSWSGSGGKGWIFCQFYEGYFSHMYSTQTHDTPHFQDHPYVILLTSQPSEREILSSRFPSCVLLALSWNTTNENPSADKLSRALN